MHDSGHSYIYRYSQHLHTLTFHIWRVVILLMRAKCVGPARVNKKAYCATRIHKYICAVRYYAIYTLYIAHTAHLFLHTFCTYMKYNIKV